jgi:hypothetical protein
MRLRLAATDVCVGLWVVAIVFEGLYGRNSLDGMAIGTSVYMLVAVPMTVLCLILAALEEPRGSA